MLRDRWRGDGFAEQFQLLLFLLWARVLNLLAGCARTLEVSRANAAAIGGSGAAQDQDLASQTRRPGHPPPRAAAHPFARTCRSPERVTRRGTFVRRLAFSVGGGSHLLRKAEGGLPTGKRGGR